MVFHQYVTFTEAVSLSLLGVNVLGVELKKEI